VHATGLCRSDWHGWQGHDPDIRLPHVPGHEFAGTVVAVGDAVRQFGVGGRVTAPFVCACGTCATCRRGDYQVCERQEQPGFTRPGSFAEYVTVPRADVNLVALPDAIDFATAAALGCRFATAYRAVVIQGSVTAGTTLLVVGCGGVGLSAIMIAVAQGADVVAVDPAPGARERAAALGAAVADSAADLSGFDVALDAVGGAGSLSAGIGALRPRGRLVQIGLLGSDTMLPAAPLARVIAKELEVVGSHGMAARDYAPMLRRIGNGELDPSALVGATIGLDEAAQALMHLPERAGAGITVVTP
jgi:alcohol dehydrogenase